MSYSKEQLSKLSGGVPLRTSYKVPTIKFNGNTGKFALFPAGNFKDGTEITDVELVIMRARRTFSSYEKIPNGTVRMFTNEHNTWKDHVTLWQAKTNEKTKVIGSGLIEQLRIEFPTLRINSNLYCLYKEEVHKLVVKGKARQSLIDKQKELASDEKEFFEKNIKLVPVQDSGDGGNLYYYLKYEVVSDSDLDKVGPHMEAIAKVMDKIDEEYVETNKRLSEEAKVLVGDKQEPELDTIEVDSEEEIIPTENPEGDSIKIDEIPFS